MDKENLRKITKLRRELHAHPELSLHEGWTKRRLMDFIEEETTGAVVDCGRWFYAARYVEGTQGVAFRADMDALPLPETRNLPWGSQFPGVSHKCGHDGHCAVLCGLALELERLNCPRSIYLIFQHAEEIGRGGQECSELLEERDIAEVYAFHNRSGWPEGTLVLHPGLCQYASRGLTVWMTGHPSHASEPERGKNPVFALAALTSHIEGLSGNVLCSIVNLRVGKKDFGISPGEGEISMTIRGESEAEVDAFEAQVRERAQELATAQGLTVNFQVSDPFPETISDGACVQRAERAARRLGKVPVSMTPWRASEDFGWYTRRRPGAILYLGNGTDWPDLHTLDYDFNDAILEPAVDLFLEIYKEAAGLIS